MKSPRLPALLLVLALFSMGSLPFGGVEITAVLPTKKHAVYNSSGGDLVVIKGKGLDQLERILFANNPASVLTVKDGETAECVTPPGYAGRVLVSAIDKSGKRTDFKGLFAYDMGEKSSLNFTNETTTRLPYDNTYSADSRVGDIDRDGDDDIVIPAQRAERKMYFNDGEGHFTHAKGFIPSGGNTTIGVDVEFADVNGDGYPDIIVGNEGQNELLINRGKKKPGFFYSVALPAAKGFTQDIAVGDIDGDGDLDFVTSDLGIGIGKGEQNQVYINDGKGNFTDKTAECLPPWSDHSYQSLLVDFDGDGDLDLFVANNGEQNRLYLNDGKGHFKDVTDANLPQDEDLNTAALAGDFDGDGDVDIISISYNTPGPNRLYLNDGKAKFVFAPENMLPLDAERRDYDCAAADLDGDGDLDLVFAGMGTISRIYVNDGKGHFTPIKGGNITTKEYYSFSVNIGDVNGDGKLDISISNLKDQQDFIYINDGAAANPDLPQVTNLFPNYGSDKGGTKIAVYGKGFKNGDKIFFGAEEAPKVRVVSPELIECLAPKGTIGMADIKVAAASGGSVYEDGFMYVSIPEGVLYRDITANVLPSVSVNHEDAAIGDFNGDGFPDIFMCTEDGPHHLFLFNPAMKKYEDVTASNLPPTNVEENNTGYCTKMFDADGDGDLDLVIANDGFTPASDKPGKQNRLYLNDGKGKFSDETAERLPKDTDHSNGVATADFNGDGLPDIVFANVGKNKVYLNGKDGKKGFFSESVDALPPPNDDDSRCVAVADVDGDGDTDIFFGNRKTRNRLYINDGKGKFTDGTEKMLPDETHGGKRGNDSLAPLFADIDGDKDMDLLIGRPFAFEAQLYINDGKGVFKEVEGFPDPDPDAQLHGSTEILLFDADLDGDLDIFVAFWVVDPTMRLLLNDGKNKFVEKRDLLPPGLGNISGARAWDYDGDGDIDLLIIRYGESVFLENKTR